MLSSILFFSSFFSIFVSYLVPFLRPSSPSFDPFIHDVARPHPGQIEVARNVHDLLNGTHLGVTVEEEKHISDDQGELRQDRYPLRTAAQFLGPQVEDILSALETIKLECNSST